MKTKPTITYIKKGKEKTVTISNDIKKEIVFANLFQTRKEKDYYSHTISSKISSIHIKDYTFKESVYFYSDYYGTTLILENCTFSCPNLYENIVLHLGSAKNTKIINPKVIGLDSSSLIIEADSFYLGYHNIEIDLTNSEGFINLIVENCNELRLNSSESLKTINLYRINKLHIENMHNTIITHFLDIENLTLKNSIIDKFNPSTIKVFGYDKPNFRVSDFLELEDSKIILPFNFETYHELEIKLKNSVIESIGYIKIPNVNFIEFNDDIEEESILDNSSYITAKELIINDYKYKSNILTSNDIKDLIPTITYIEDNEEITLEIPDKYLESNVLSNYIPNSSCGTTEFIPSSIIELIHIKNATFDEILYIYLNLNQILILENCNFINSFHNQILIEEGNIEIINPALQDCETLVIEKATTANIVFTKNPNTTINIKVLESKEFQISDNEKIVKLDIEANKTYLKDFKNIKKLNLTTKELILDDCTITNLEQNIIFSNLSMKNSCLEDKKIIELDSLSLDENSTLTSWDKIKIGEFIYTKQNNKPVTIKSSNLNGNKNISIKRQELIYLLKKLQKKVNQNYEEEIKKLNKRSIDKYLKK